MCLRVICVSCHHAFAPARVSLSLCFSLSPSYLLLPSSVNKSYLKYAEAGAQALRNALKPELRAVAARRNENGIKFAKWEQGKPSESSASTIMSFIDPYMIFSNGRIGVVREAS